jgi:hypothetical protein
MKRIILFAMLISTVTCVFGQKSIDAIFDRYAGKDGFTTVTINGNILKLAGIDRNSDDSFPADITEIRILAQNSDYGKVENFYDRVISGLNLNDYEEFMRVKESDQDLRMLVRAEGNKFREFLLISGGQDNALIQIKGNMTFGEARKFSQNIKNNHGLDFNYDHR